MTSTDTLVGPLASFVHRTSFDDLPTEVVAAAKARLLDVIGSALWGVHVGTARAMRDVTEPLAGLAEATVIGRPVRLPALAACYLNSCASPALLDTCRFSVTHPGIVTIPAALAAAEQAHASGRDLIVAIVLGYEVLIRLGKATRPADRGFVPTAVLGPFASATAAAKLLGLSREQTVHALAIAGTMGAGLLEAYAAIDSGRSQFGRAAQGGLLAAQLARQGVQGSPRILEGGGLEGTKGFLAAYSEHADLRGLTEGLGSDFGLPKVAPKVHDGCRYTNAAADAALLLASRHGLIASDIRRIHVRTFALALKVSVRAPTTVSGALFCIEFVVATALLSGDVFNDRFSLDRLNDPLVRTLMGKVNVALDDAMEAAYPDKLGLAMDIETTDGRWLACQLDFPRGEPENPLSVPDIEFKFKRLATPVLGDRRVAEVVATIGGLESIPEVGILTDLCRPIPTR